ncbi:MAG TPA: endonuclease/exonuclease/phosphatase family protein, partial [Thermodesulfobacteriota bacterium]|nr:endonuclease/exonuclease/phosphatase family protein [Thermodesulfobacteriota bacterium]
MEPPENPTVLRLTVATYNIHGCIGMDRRYRPERVAAVIRELGADVVALQEVDRRPRAGCPPLALEQLAGPAGYTAVAGPNFEEGGGDFGNALLTAHPVLAVRRIDLSVPGRQPRGALDVDLEVGGELVRVIVTHHGLGGDRERRVQVARLLEALEARPAGRVVLLGDFNEWHPYSRALGLLAARFGRSRAPATWPSVRPVLALDRIWAAPAGAL